MLKWSLQHNNNCRTPDSVGQDGEEQNKDLDKGKEASGGGEMEERPPEDGSRFHLANWLINNTNNSSSNSGPSSLVTVSEPGGGTDTNHRRLLTGDTSATSAFSPMATVYGSLNRMRHHRRNTQQQQLTGSIDRRHNRISSLSPAGLGRRLSAGRSSSSDSRGGGGGKQWRRPQEPDVIGFSSAEATAIQHHNYRYSSSSSLLESYLAALSPGSKRHSSSVVGSPRLYSRQQQHQLPCPDFIVTQSVGRKHGVFISKNGAGGGGVTEPTSSSLARKVLFPCNSSEPAPRRMKKTTSVPEFNNLRISYDEDMIRRLALYNSLSIDNKKDQGPDNEYDDDDKNPTRDNSVDKIFERPHSEEEDENNSDLEDDDSTCSVDDKPAAPDLIEKYNDDKGNSLSDRERETIMAAFVASKTSDSISENGDEATMCHMEDFGLQQSDHSLSSAEVTESTGLTADPTLSDDPLAAPAPSVGLDLIQSSRLQGRPPTILLTQMSITSETDNEVADLNKVNEQRSRLLDGDEVWTQNKIIHHHSLPDIVKQFGGERDFHHQLPKFRDRNYLVSWQHFLTNCPNLVIQTIR